MVLAAASVIAVSLFGAFGSTLLQAEILALHTPEYVEKLAREQLGLVKPGEIAFLIVQPPADTPPGRPLPQDTRERPAPARGDWLSGLRDAVRHLFDR